MSHNPPSDGLDDLFDEPVNQREPDPEEIFQPLEPPTDDFDDDQFAPLEPRAIVPLPLPSQSQSDEPTLPDDIIWVYTITLPKGAPWRPALAQTLIESLRTLGEVTLRIVYDNGQIVWQVLDIGRYYHADGPIAATIRSAYPDADVTVAPYGEPPFVRPYTKVVFPFRQQEDFFRPIKYAHELKDHDPLVLLSNAMNLAEPGERVSYILHIGRDDPEALNRAWNKITKSNVNWVASLIPEGRSADQMFWSVVWKTTFGTLQKARENKNPGLRAPKFVNEDQKVFWEKINNYLFHAYIFVEIDVYEPTRLAQFVPTLQAIGREFDTPYQRLVLPDRLDEFMAEITSPEQARNQSVLTFLEAVVEKPEKRAKRRWGRAVKPSDPRARFASILNCAELAALWHMPHEGFGASKIAWAKRSVPMPEAMKGRDTSRDSVQLGVNRYAGREAAVVLPNANRTSHVAIFGKTGSGKTNLMHQLIQQDIQRGSGVAVIDPTGRLVADILRWSIPPGREQDVVVLDVANREYPPPLNLLSMPADAEQDMAVTQLVSVLDKFGSFTGTQTVSETLAAALATVLYDETPTLRDIPKLFEDDAYRERLLERMDNPGVEDFWSGFYGKNKAHNSQLVRPVVYRVSQFYSNSLLYPMTCHPDRLDLAHLIAQNKIILMALNTNKRLTEQQEKLLGAVLVSLIQIAAMNRGEHAPPFYLYVDEVQSYITSSIDTMLSRARQFGLSLTIANQYFQQLTERVAASVFGNVGALIAFQLGHEDAPQIVKYMDGFDATDILQLDAFNAVAFMRHGIQSHAFSLTTLPPLKLNKTDAEVEAAVAREQQLRMRSIERYTPKNAKEITAWLTERYKKPEKPKRAARAKKTTNPDDFLSPKKRKKAIDE
jgi:GTPase SAR1 family protein